MSEPQKLSHGEPLWDTKYNQLVDYVTQIGGTVNNLQLTEPTNSGIVLLNNVKFDNPSSETFYQKIKFKNVSLVAFHILLMVDSVPDNTFAMPVAQVPDSIKPISNVNAIEPGGVSSASGTWPLFLFIGKDGKLWVSAESKLAGGNRAEWYLLFLY